MAAGKVSYRKRLRPLDWRSLHEIYRIRFRSEQRENDAGKL